MRYFVLTEAGKCIDVWMNLMFSHEAKYSFLIGSDRLVNVLHTCAHTLILLSLILNSKILCSPYLD